MTRTVSTWCQNRQAYSRTSNGCLYRANHGDLYVTMHLASEANEPPRRIIKASAPIDSIPAFDRALETGAREQLRYVPVKTGDALCAETT